MSQTIAVTAATGHLGRLVIDELLQRVPAEQVVAVVEAAGRGLRPGRRGGAPVRERHRTAGRSSAWLLPFIKQAKAVQCFMVSM